MNPLKARLAAGETIKAAWAELGSPDAAEIMVRHGWNTIIIDGEHGIGDLEIWVAIARAIEAAGGEVILRVPEGSDALLKRVLDRGFRSIIVPMVNSAQEAARIAAACRYPPLGRRGYAAPVVRGSGFGSVPGYALHAAFQRVEQAVAASGKMLGTITGPGRSWGQLAAGGYRLIVGPTDAQFVIAGARASAEAARG